MMNNIQIIEILKELVKKSNEYKDGFLTPEECKLQISELDNYDFFLFEILEGTERELWTKTGSQIDKTIVAKVPILKIENDSVLFIPRIVREFLKEIES